MNCEFCKKDFSSKYTLSYHKKTNKKCITIQENENKTVETEFYECRYCKKNLISKNIKTHLQSCKKRKDIEIIEKDYLINELQEEHKKREEELKEELKQIENELKEELRQKDEIIIELKMTIAELNIEKNIYKDDHESMKKLAMQPKTTTNNNIYNNLSVFDKDILTERLNSSLQNITPEQLYDGQKSVAKILAPCLDNGDGTKMVSCSDKSRGTLVSKDKNGNINKDFNAKNLVDVIHPIVLTKADEVNKNDMVKREKSYKLKSLKDDIEKRENEIEQFKATMKGFKKNSGQYLQYQHMIKSREEKNERDILEIEELECAGVEEPRDDFVLYDEKLVEGIEDITKMKEDSTKFKNSLSKEI